MAIRMHRTRKFSNSSPSQSARILLKDNPVISTSSLPTLTLNRKNSKTYCFIKYQLFCKLLQKTSIKKSGPPKKLRNSDQLMEVSDSRREKMKEVNFSSRVSIWRTKIRKKIFSKKFKKIPTHPLSAKRAQQGKTKTY